MVKLDPILESSKRKKIGKGFRYKIVESQSFKCKKCHKKFNPPNNFHIDHKDGNAKNNVRSNLQALCPDCHNAKTLKQEPKKHAKKEHELPSALRNPLGF